MIYTYVSDRKEALTKNAIANKDAQIKFLREHLKETRAQLNSEIKHFKSNRLKSLKNHYSAVSIPALTLESLLV